MELKGVAHVAITVADLQRSRDWYERILNWSSVFEGEGEGVRFDVGSVPGGPMVGLRQYESSQDAAFDPTRVGLDHLAFEVGREDLAGWEQRFTELGVEHDAVQDTPYGLVLNFKDPDGIALEIFASKT